jgi:ribonuclease HII
MLLMGIDEAGRGCVFGPLVVAAFACQAGQLDAVAATGVTDSKRLSPKRRQALLEPLGALGRAELLEITPAAIDAGNINTLELEAMAALIRSVRPDAVWIDGPVHPRGIPRFERQLRSLLEHHPQLVIEPKADLNYPVVSAASIFAKTTRDAHIHALDGVGSGYPSDPKTRAHLQGLIASGAPLPPYVRQRWGTVRDMLQMSLLPDAGDPS